MVKGQRTSDTRETFWLLCHSGQYPQDLIRHEEGKQSIKLHGFYCWVKSLAWNTSHVHTFPDIKCLGRTAMGLQVQVEKGSLKYSGFSIVVIETEVLHLALTKDQFLSLYSILRKL